MNIKLKMKIIEVGITQRKLAKLTDIPDTRISEIVQEVRKPTDEQKEAIARKLECKINDIF